MNCNYLSTSVFYIFRVVHVACQRCVRVGAASLLFSLCSIQLFIMSASQTESLGEVRTLMH